MNLLFVCSRNQWRSPTAERVWQNVPSIKVRSAGTSPRAKRTVSEADIRWADQIFVMEYRHKKQIAQRFSDLVQSCAIHVLDIPDDYGYMDAELVELLETRVHDILNEIA